MLKHVCKLITKIENILTTLPSCLGKALLFKVKKVREGKGNKT